MPLSTLFKSMYDFKDEDLALILEAFKSSTFNEGDLILREGEISDKIYFILDGILREYSFIETNDEPETESTFWILGANQWVYQVESFVTNTPSKSFLQALTKLKVMYLYKSDMERLLDEIPALSKVVIKLYEYYLLQLEKRNHLHKIKKAENRLDVFEQNHPDILNRVKLRIIASFLNITPSELSRIRSRRTKTVD